jgi:hypothetical protein
VNLVPANLAFLGVKLLERFRHSLALMLADYVIDDIEAVLIQLLSLCSGKVGVGHAEFAECLLGIHAIPPGSERDV